MARLVLVGCGQIGMAAHLPALKALADEGLAEVIACDADPGRAEAASKRFGVASSTDWEREALEGAHAVAVCTPPGPNAEIAIRALELGRHVLCEKPPGRSPAQARAMAAAASERPGQVAMMAFNRRFSPLYRRAMDRSLAVGAPTVFSGRFTRDALGAAPSNTASDWILADSSHPIDLAVATMGFPHAFSVARSVVGGGPDNVWTVQLHAERGSAVLLFDYAAGRQVERYEWAGPGYDALVEIPKRAEWAQSGSAVETWREVDVSPSSSEAFTKGFVDEYRCFLAAVTGAGPRPECDFAYGADLMGLMGQIVEASPGTVHPVVRAQSRPGPDQIGPDAHVDGEAAARRGVGRPTVLIHHPVGVQHRFFPPERLLAVKERADVHSWTGGDADRAALETAEVVVTGRGAPKLRPETLELAPKLSMLVVLGASVRHLHPEALLERGVRITNTADAVAQGVAEHCLMVTLAGLRQLTRIDSAVHNGEWPRPAAPGGGPGAHRPAGGGGRARQVARRLPIPEVAKARLRTVEGAIRRARARHRSSGGGAYHLPHDLHGQVVGLVGWGHTARRFAELLAPFECTLLVSTEAGDLEDLRSLGARTASLGEILGSAKVISLHKGLTDDTRRFLDGPLLAQVRPGSVLVNTARAELVDEAALIERLRQGDIVAALDVFHEEPLPPTHPLRGLPNVILTPHNASATVGEERRIGEQALDAVIRWLDGDDVETLEAGRLARMT